MHNPDCPTPLFYPDISMLDDTLPPLITTPPGRYRHYKGMLYEVVGTVRHSETLEPMTLYRALYGEHGLWVRPAAMFEEEVVIDGVRQPRFTLVGASAA
ncbi:hypothetical protein os1_04840 [Comamonadaceae bacterium OS-1]|nr:hypothetical protein os1_04840 [Comamonadaceae bacterium OS-1]